MMHTGMIVAGRPSIGAWVAYGLGTDNQNLPAYVVLPDPRGLPVDGIRNWSSGWLPPLYQGTPFRSEGMPVLNLRPRTPRPADVEEQPPATAERAQRRAHADAIPKSWSSTPASPASSWPRGCSSRPPTPSTSRRKRQATQRLYGLDNPTHAVLRHALPDGPAAGRARRPLRADLHGRPAVGHARQQRRRHTLLLRADRPARSPACSPTCSSAACSIDAGLLGRRVRPNPRRPGTDGRDHHPYGFSVWLAGGGIKGGQAYGATDDFGYHAVTERTSVADLHATMLHLLGLDYRRLNFSRLGRDERITDVHEPNVLPLF